MSDFPLITSDADLIELCQQLQSAEWLAVDTEFHRDDTYYPKLALIQIGDAEGGVWLVDPLAVTLDPLLDLLYNPNITNVMHSAGQDLELFYHLRGELPKPLFDTQLAAALLGLGEQIGYAKLVQERLGISLAKAHTRANWLRRPLSEGELDYAAADVIHLAKLYPALRADLAERGRLDWLQPEFDRMTDPDRYVNPPDAAWLRIKGGSRLKPKETGLAQALAAWREQRAQERDKPRGWILKDDLILDVVRQRPSDLSAFGRIRGVTDGLMRHQGEELLKIIAAAPEQASGKLPEQRRPVALTSEQDAVVDVLLAVVRLQAAEQDISLATLASRKQVEQLVGQRSGPLLQGWRQAAIGSSLLAVLDGERTIRLRDGKVEIA